MRRRREKVYLLSNVTNNVTTKLRRRAGCRRSEEGNVRSVGWKEKEG